MNWSCFFLKKQAFHPAFHTVFHFFDGMGRRESGNARTTTTESTGTGEEYCKFALTSNVIKWWLLQNAQLSPLTLEQMEERLVLNFGQSLRHFSSEEKVWVYYLIFYSACCHWMMCIAADIMLYTPAPLSLSPTLSSLLRTQPAHIHST